MSKLNITDGDIITKDNITYTIRKIDMYYNVEYEADGCIGYTNNADYFRGSKEEVERYLDTGTYEGNQYDE